MSKLIDFTGKRFGKLIVVSKSDSAKSTKSSYTETQWICKCDCGNLIVVRHSTLTRGKNNCGCLPKFMPIKHGKSHTRIHGIWIGMRQRCNNPNYIEFDNYGGRGIRVCNEWDCSFESFYDWAINNEYSDKLTIDRIDVNGNYEPSNCRWATLKEQANNKRDTLYLTYNGETLPFETMCKKYHVNYHTAYIRFKKGWSADDILFNKPWKHHSRLEDSNAIL